MSAKDGGPAFPVFQGTPVGHAAAFRGMTLRDYFAGQVLAGLLAVPATTSNTSYLADECYRQADAMLVERDKP